MKWLIFIFLFSIHSALLAEVQIGYQGCGEYLFKGEVFILTEHPKDKEFPWGYKVNPGTKSQMIFKFKKEDDALVAGGFLKQPTSFIADIQEPMDGTLGYIENIKKLGRRFPDPLHPITDSGIFLQSKKECQKK